MVFKSPFWIQKIWKSEIWTECSCFPEFCENEKENGRCCGLFIQTAWLRVQTVPAWYNGYYLVDHANHKNSPISLSIPFSSW